MPNPDIDPASAHLNPAPQKLTTTSTVSSRRAVLLVLSVTIACFCAFGGLGEVTHKIMAPTVSSLDSAERTTQPNPNTQPTPNPAPAPSPAHGEQQPASCVSGLEVKLLPFKLTEDHSKSIAEITRLSDPSTVNSLSKIYTIGHIYTISSIQADDPPKVPGGGCSILRLTVGYRDPVLRVARELSASQCSFAHVYAHEMEHVRIYEEGLASMQAKIQQRFGEALEKHRVMSVGILESSEAQAGEAVKSNATSIAWQPGLRLAFNAAIDVMAEISSVHAKLDGPQSYRSNRDACNGRIERITKAAASRMD